MHLFCPFQALSQLPASPPFNPLLKLCIVFSNTVYKDTTQTCLFVFSPMTICYLLNWFKTLSAPHQTFIRNDFSSDLCPLAGHCFPPFLLYFPPSQYASRKPSAPSTLSLSLFRSARSAYCLQGFSSKGKEKASALTAVPNALVPIAQQPRTKQKHIPSSVPSLLHSMNHSPCPSTHIHTFTPQPRPLTL